MQRSQNYELIELKVIDTNPAGEVTEQLDSSNAENSRNQSVKKLKMHHKYF